MTVVVPELLRESQGASPQGRAWLDALPGIVRQLAEQWSLQVGTPFRPGGTTAWVAPARDGTGRDLVLKVGRAHEEAEHEAEGLRAWQGRGVVGVHAAARLAGTVALLLERCRPGTPLGERVAETEQDVVVTRLLQRLHGARTDGPFRPLAQMCDMWAAGFRRRSAAAAPGRADPGLARDAVALFTQLPRTADRQVLLATDLHAGNVLASSGDGGRGHEQWLVIDPKPYVGDPCYDVLQHALNCPQRLVSDPVGLAQHLADLAQLDADRVRLWLFARCAVESLERPDLAAAATTLAP
jgi:streptomycin 6-kinase